MGKAGSVLIQFPRLATALALLGLLGVSPAFAVEPSSRYAMDPKRTGLVFEDVSFPAATDSARIHGWWFPAAAPAPVVVLCPRGKGNMADLLPVVIEFARRGFAVLTFDYRDFGPGGSGAADSLRNVVFASRWVDDAEGAFRFARVRAKDQTVFGWGQDLGAAVAFTVTGRERRLVDGIAIEGIFRSTEEYLAILGLSQDPEVMRRHRALVRPMDEPNVVVSRAYVGLFLVLAGKDDVTPAATTLELLGTARPGPQRYFLPEAGHEGAERTPGYFDRIAEWFRLKARMLTRPGR